MPLGGRWRKQNTHVREPQPQTVLGSTGRERGTERRGGGCPEEPDLQEQHVRGMEGDPVWLDNSERGGEAAHRADDTGARDVGLAAGTQREAMVGF